MPFKASQFSLISAFDTINLWDDIELCMKEISRILKSGGLFVIVNAYPKEGSKWWNIVRFKSDSDYISFLEKKGFEKIDSELIRNTIMIIAKKK